MTSASGDRPPLDVLVIGGGQAGLAMGHQLDQLGLRFQIVAPGHHRHHFRGDIPAPTS